MEAKISIKEGGILYVEGNVRTSEDLVWKDLKILCGECPDDVYVYLDKSVFAFFEKIEITGRLIGG